MARVQSVILKCASCGAEVLDKADHPDWKGIPMAPNSAELRWFCREKEPCKKAFQRAYNEANEAWSRRSSGGDQSPKVGNGGEV